MCTIFPTNRKLQFGCVSCTNMSSVSFSFFQKWKCPVLPKSRRFKVALVNKINVLVLEIKSISSRIRTGRASFTSIYTVSIKTGVWNAECGRRTADCGLQTADCRLWTADYGLGVKRILRYKTRTKQYGLNIKRGLRTKFSLPTSVDDFYSPVVTNIR